VHLHAHHDIIVMLLLCVGDSGVQCITPSNQYPGARVFRPSAKFPLLPSCDSGDLACTHGLLPLLLESRSRDTLEGPRVATGELQAASALVLGASINRQVLQMYRRVVRYLTELVRSSTICGQDPTLGVTV
jgi:hypothetical protein